MKGTYKGYQKDVIDVEAARGNVGGNQYVARPRLELLQHLCVCVCANRG